MLCAAAALPLSDVLGRGLGALANSWLKPVFADEKAAQLWIDVLDRLERSGFAASTSRKYDSAQAAFARFCQEFGLEAFPASPVSIMMYASYLLSLGRALSTIEGHLSAIASSYTTIGQPSPTADPLVRKFMLAAGRDVGRRRVHAQPLALHHLFLLERLIDVNSFVAVRNFCLILFSWLAFLRASESVALLPGDVEVAVIDNLEFVVLRVEKSKTDQERRGDFVLLQSVPSSPLCPVRWFRLYDRLRNRSASAFFHQSSPHSSKALSASTPTHIVQDMTSSFRSDFEWFTAHSLRAGGASHAFGLKLPQELIKRHGRWRSDAYFLYCHESLRDRLGVSRDMLLLGSPVATPFAFELFPPSHSAPRQQPQSRAQSSSSTDADSVTESKRKRRRLDSEPMFQLVPLAESSASSAAQPEPSSSAPSLQQPPSAGLSGSADVLSRLDVLAAELRSSISARAVQRGTG